MEQAELEKFIGNLQDANTINYVDMVFKDLMINGEMYDCWLFINYLGKQMSADPSLPTKNPGLYEAYQTVWHLMTFKIFPILSNIDQQTLLQKRFLYAVQKGFDPDFFISKFFDLYDHDTVVKQFGGYVQDLEKNTETLGYAPIESEGNKLLPQVKNWVLDYSRFPSPSSKRGSIDRLNYSNQSANPKTLTQGQRQVLLKVLKFYDDLKNCEPVVAPESYNLDDSPVNLEQYVQQSRQAQQTPQSPVQAPTAPAKMPAQKPAAPKAPGIDIQKKLDELKNRVN